MAATAFLLPWACLLSLALVARSTADGGPVLWNRPFVTVWNAPSQECSTKYHVPLDLGVFDVVLNRNESFLGQEIALFYSNTLGLYPHYTPEGMAAHGGIPQNGSLLAHLGKARHDIQAAISEPSFRGLAVIDWESWRPVWARNWDAMELYKEKSQELVREQHLDWPPDRVAEEAQEEFEQSARAFMEQTLALGKSLRPGGFWGFYGFPSCYNYDFKAANYTGECPAVEQRRNEQLWWLWNQSRALYPSIYLPKELRLTDQVGKFVRHRVAEAFRVQGQMGTGSLSVLPYARIQYDFTEDFLSQEDLVHTIGESASQGASGVVLWGNEDYTRSRVRYIGGYGCLWVGNGNPGWGVDAPALRGWEGVCGRLAWCATGSSQVCVMLRVRALGSGSPCTQELGGWVPAGLCGREAQQENGPLLSSERALPGSVLCPPTGVLPGTEGVCGQQPGPLHHECDQQRHTVQCHGVLQPWALCAASRAPRRVPASQPLQLHRPEASQSAPPPPAGTAGKAGASQAGGRIQLPMLHWLGRDPV
ncbi:hyaluronidase-1 isoform X1 [Mauremys reevesii]|uniref:hyaluronidase-1 isoform X1 n=1 Tax=Mauremys reevesii TaxID=260615 RepID=UPI00193F74EB|nr:hyaluronidase-1 isoform X1 [Mauremys reevesii]